MENLHNTTQLVKAILEQDKQSRNSDSFLYLKVLTTIGERNGIDIEAMSITTFLTNLREFGFPPFESVRRTRQKVQATFPELAPDSRVKSLKNALESEYRAFARSEIDA